MERRYFRFFCSVLFTLEFKKWKEYFAGNFLKLYSADEIIITLWTGKYYNTIKQPVLGEKIMLLIVCDFILEFAP